MVNKSPILTFLESYKWVIIGLGLLIVSVVTFVTTYKLCKHNGQSDSRVSINYENAAISSNTSPTCPATTMAHTGKNPIEKQSDQAKPSSESAPHSYASLDIPTLLKKDPRTYTMNDRLVHSRHSQRKMEAKE